MGHRSSVLAMIACTVAGACVADSSLAVCTDELRVRFTPADTTIVLSQAFTASVRLSTCGGARSLSDTFTWASEDTSVATVDSRTGRVTGRGLGETHIAARGQRYGVLGGLRVAVGMPLVPPLAP